MRKYFLFRRKKAKNSTEENDYSTPPVNTTTPPLELHSSGRTKKPETSFPVANDSEVVYAKVQKPRSNPDDLEIHENQSYALFGQ